MIDLKLPLRLNTAVCKMTRYRKPLVSFRAQDISWRVWTSDDGNHQTGYCVSGQNNSNDNDKRAQYVLVAPTTNFREHSTVSMTTKAEHSRHYTRVQWEHSARGLLRLSFNNMWISRQRRNIFRRLFRSEDCVQRGGGCFPAGGGENPPLLRRPSCDMLWGSP